MRDEYTKTEADGERPSAVPHNGLSSTNGQDNRASIADALYKRFVDPLPGKGSNLPSWREGFVVGSVQKLLTEQIAVISQTLSSNCENVLAVVKQLEDENAVLKNRLHESKGNLWQAAQASKDDGAVGTVDVVPLDSGDEERVPTPLSHRSNRLQSPALRGPYNQASPEFLHDGALSDMERMRANTLPMLNVPEPPPGGTGRPLHSPPSPQDNLRAARHSEFSQTFRADSSPNLDEAVRGDTSIVGFTTDSSTLRAQRNAIRPRGRDSVREMGASRHLSQRNPATKKQHENPVGPNGRAVFADVEMLKERVRMAMGRPEYTVFDLYKTSGFFQHVARNPHFEHVALAVIALNAIWIAVDADYNEETVLMDSHPVFQVGEHLFCTYFTVEWIFRFGAFKSKLRGFRDRWFFFDTILVVLMIFETWLMTVVMVMSGYDSGNALGDASILRLLRLLRISRMARMAKLLRAFPEIMILIKGMSVAMRAVNSTLILLIIIMYVFAIGFTQMTRGMPLGDQYFSSVATSMKSLLLHGTFLEDIPDLANAMVEENILIFFVMIFYVLLATLTVMNMLVGVLVEVVSVVAAVEKEQLVVNYVRQQLQSLWDYGGLDTSGDGLMQKDEFENLLENPEASRCLSDVGVDVVGLVDFAEFIFRDEELTFGDFVELVLTLRGSNTATVKDMVDMRKFTIQEFDRISGSVRKVADQVTRVEMSLTHMLNKNMTKSRVGWQQADTSVLDMH